MKWLRLPKIGKEENIITIKDIKDVQRLKELGHSHMIMTYENGQIVIRLLNLKRD